MHRHRRQPETGRFQPADQGEERPVLRHYGAALVGALEDRVRRVGREGVAGIRRDHLVDHAAVDEKDAERAERRHHQRAAGVGAPVLPGELAGGRSPAVVTHRDADRVAWPHMPLDSGAQREVLLRRWHADGR